MVRVRRATKIEVLEFIWKMEIVRIHDLVDRFGYTEGGACWRLVSLKKEGLVDNEQKGEWTITDLGLKRLAYYGMLK